MTKRWNSRFVAYARSHGRTPEAQLRHDQTEWPGGCMCGFILWMDLQWDNFRKLHGARSREALILGLKDAQRLFDQYLAREEV